jgi:branched-chain amino acid transport system permease protein
MRVWQITAALLVSAVALSAFAPLLSPFHLRLGISVFLSAGMAVSWYILGGFANYYSFGHTAFVGVGAFACGLALERWRPDNWPCTLLLGAAAAMLACAFLAALIAPAILRLRGHYFTIAMLAVALVCGEASSAFPLFRGSIGLSLPDIAPPSVSPELFFYLIALAALALIIIVALVISRSRLGYGLFAIREDEEAAQMLGVPTARTKIMAFVVSSSLTGLMGALYAFNLAYITTDSVFRGSLSLEMIVNCLVGGMSSLFGPVLGAIAMTFITKVLLGGLLEYHLAITGLIVIFIVYFAPGGLLGLGKLVRRRLLKPEAMR